MKSIVSSYSMPLLLALLLAGGGILATAANAMPAGGPDGKPHCEARQAQTLPSRMQAQRDRHLASLKEKLQLSPEQEAAWNSFTATLQSGMRQAGAGMQAMREEFRQLNTAERIDRMKAFAEARLARMAERAEAIKDFYLQLTPAQQAVFDAEAMPLREHRHGRDT